MLELARHVRRLAAVVLASAALTLVALAGPARAEFGVASFSSSLSTTQAGAHGDFSTTIALNTDALGNPDGQLKDATVTLPEGLIGNPLAIERCSIETLDRFACGRASQVGVLGLSVVACRGVTAKLAASVEAGATTIVVPNAKAFCYDETNNGNLITIGEGAEAETVRIFNIPDASTIELQAPVERSHAAGEVVTHIAEPDSGGIPLFNVRPSPGYVATFAASLLLANVFVDVGVQRDGRLVATIHGISTVLPLQSTTLTLWGVPAASSHDAQRCNELDFECGPLIDGEPEPFVTNPSSCSGPLQTELNVDSWQGRSASSVAALPTLTGCDALALAPSLTVTPSTTRRDSPAGYEVELTVPQAASPSELGTPPIERISVRLPRGTSLSPGLANGLAVCADAEFEVDACPDASKLGTAEVASPLLAEPLQGAIYIGAPTEGERYRLFLHVGAGAVAIDLRGQVVADEATDQLTAVFDHTPALPLSRLSIDFFGGPGAALANPPDCGAVGASAAVSSYAGQVADASSAFTIDEDAGGGPCPSRSPFAPRFAAGTTNARAGHSTPFVLTIARADGEQRLRSFSARLPAGLVGLVGSVPLCAEPAAAAGTCPQASQIGSATVAAGAGSQPFDVSGPVYLTGPYDGAPFGLDIAVRAVVGPFDLGTALVRARILVDPTTLALTIASDPLPQTLGGIPLRLRGVAVDLDRAGFLFNPTSCSAQAISATIESTQGTSTEPTTPFAVGDCSHLSFGPRVTASTQARASLQGEGAGIVIKLVNPSATTSAVRTIAVQIPKQLRPRLTTIQHACLAAGRPGSTAGCPAESIVGRATVRSPVVAAPLSGSIYLLAHGGTALPTLFTSLRGEGLQVDLEGQLKISAKNAISASFDGLPDVPISSIELALPRGPYSMLGATANLCNAHPALGYRLGDQDGASANGTSRLAVSGCPHPTRRGKARHSRAKRSRRARPSGGERR